METWPVSPREIQAQAASAPAVDDALRQSRTCYCHLAGQLGVLLSDALVRKEFVAVNGREGQVTAKGLDWCRAEQIGFSLARLPHLRVCNDWTERRPHFSGPFPNAILQRLSEARCLEPRDIPRALRLTRKGRAFFDRLGVAIPF